MRSQCWNFNFLNFFMRFLFPFSQGMISSVHYIKCLIQLDCLFSSLPLLLKLLFLKNEVFIVILLIRVHKLLSCPQSGLLFIFLFPLVCRMTAVPLACYLFAWYWELWTPISLVYCVFIYIDTYFRWMQSVLRYSSSVVFFVEIILAWLHISQITSSLLGLLALSRPMFAIGFIGFLGDCS